MAKQLNVYGFEAAQGVELGPAEVQHWDWHGGFVQDGSPAWVVIKPSPAYPGVKVLEIQNFSEVIDEDGTRHIWWDVKNTGQNLIRYYKVYLLWTDALPT